MFERHFSGLKQCLIIIVVVPPVVVPTVVVVVVVAPAVVPAVVVPPVVVPIVVVPPVVVPAVVVVAVVVVVVPVVVTVIVAVGVVVPVVVTVCLCFYLCFSGFNCVCVQCIINMYNQYPNSVVKTFSIFLPFPDWVRNAHKYIYTYILLGNPLRKSTTYKYIYKYK